MSTMVRAAVATEPRHTEVKEFALPEIPPDAGLMRVEATGICGSDWGMYLSAKPGPRILGHEMVGIIEKLGDVARARWGVKEGDVVALEEYLPCGHCEYCRTGEYRSCLRAERSRIPGSIRYGSTPLTVNPSLWGGYAQYLYMHPRSVLHNVPAGVPAHIAAMALPIGNGFQWAYLDGGVSPGKTIVIQGPGQQGLGCVIRGEVGGGGTHHRLRPDARREAAGGGARTRCASYRDGRSGKSERGGAAHHHGGRMVDIVIDNGGVDPTSSVRRWACCAAAASWSCRPRKGAVGGSTSIEMVDKQIVVRGTRGP